MRRTGIGVGPAAFIAAALVSHAEDVGRPPVSGETLGRPWKAQWIACAGAPERDPGVYRFRKTIELAAAPSHYVVHVSGDQRFVLYVNGRRVGIGPSRGDVFHWRFETFDLAPFLRAGANLLVAMVWNFGSEAPAAQITDRTGFVLQGDGPAEAAVNTGNSWQCAPEPGHQPWPEGARALRQAGTYFVVGPGERLDAARYDWDWAERPGAGKPSGRWQPAVAHGAPSPRSISEAPGYALSPETPWLVPDDLPPMEYRGVPAGAVVRASGIPMPVGFPERPLEIPARTKATLLLDRRELVAAYPELVFSGGRGARVRLTYQEALTKERFFKGNRNELEGKGILGLTDEVLPDGGKERVFHALWWRTWRFLELSVETEGELLTLERLGAWSTGYPFEEKAKWSAGDDTLSRIWATGWRTARLCAHETYVDCPYYEQLQYVGDTRVQALISYTVAGDDRLARQAIRTFERSRRSDGITSSRYPAAVPQYIPPFSLLWVGMVHDYWRYRDDPAFVREQLAGTRTVLDFFLAHQRADGLLGRLPWWNFVDWATDFAEGVPPQDADGGSVALTLQMVNALREAAELEGALGEAARAELYRGRAQTGADAVVRLAWDAGKGLVADTPARSTFSQQSNILALLADAVPSEAKGAVLDKLLAEPMLSSKDGAFTDAGAAPPPRTGRGGLGLTKASYYFRFYLARVLEKLGRGDEYLRQLEPWREMLELGLSTWAEAPDLASRSDCHAWSAHPNYDLLTIVAGIKPGGPGFRRVRIEPHLGTLDHLEAGLPHPKGPIAVAYRKEAGGVNAIVTLPEGLEGELVWGDETRPLHGGTQTLRLPLPRAGGA
jgi:alpha-L-rhamnosidase